MVVGDVHARFDLLNKAMEHHKPEVVLQCGELGFWPGIDKYSLDKIKNGDCKIYFCDGNHDNHWALRDLKSSEAAPNVIFMRRGDVVELAGKTILFMGGAASIDKHIRQIGVDWFPEETIAEKDFNNLKIKRSSC